TPPRLHRKNPPPIELVRPSVIDTQKEVPIGVYIRRDGIHPGKPLLRHEKSRAKPPPNHRSHHEDAAV
ncbi:MAG: hypothetical protein ACO2PN_19260, partial [Pyrobaculum sp.]